MYFADTTDIYYSYSFPQKIFIEFNIRTWKQKTDQ
jgi:hypothetical protein